MNSDSSLMRGHQGKSEFMHCLSEDVVAELTND